MHPLCTACQCQERTCPAHTSSTRAHPYHPAAPGRCLRGTQDLLEVCEQRPGSTMTNHAQAFPGACARSAHTGAAWRAYTELAVWPAAFRTAPLCPPLHQAPVPATGKAESAVGCTQRACLNSKPHSPRSPTLPARLHLCAETVTVQARRPAVRAVGGRQLRDHALPGRGADAAAAHAAVQAQAHVQAALRAGRRQPGLLHEPGAPLLGPHGLRAPPARARGCRCSGLAALHGRRTPETDPPPGARHERRRRAGREPDVRVRRLCRRLGVHGDGRGRVRCGRRGRGAHRGVKDGHLGDQHAAREQVAAERLRRRHGRPNLRRRARHQHLRAPDAERARARQALPHPTNPEPALAVCQGQAAQHGAEAASADRRAAG